MTKRGGKAKVLAPGKLQEERNRIINKKHIVRKPAQTTLSMQDASSAPTLAQAASSVQAASSMPTPAPTVVPVHATTFEKFSFMPTPTLSHQTMAGPQSINL